MIILSASFNKRIYLFFFFLFFFVANETFSQENFKPVINIEDAIIKLKSGNDIEALLDFEILAAEGNAQAQSYLGQMYRKGRGFGIADFAKAAMWLRKSAESGNASAHHRLGWMHARGEIDGKRNNEMAVKSWLEAAKLGNPYAQSDLGVMYWRGDGVTKDLILAYRWLLSSSNQLGEINANLAALENEMSQKDINKAKAMAE